ncbi:MAG: PDZ domain-containing protein [Candidatus Stygibacter australis]|nr:PDZ domain-containing protein [Candidatus Stygibacter australis]
MKNFVIIFICMLLLISCSTFKKVEDMQFPEKGGVLISNFTENSVLEAAGARKNDVILKYDGVMVESVEQLGTLKSEVKSEMVEVEIYRQGELLVIQIPAGQIGVYLMPIPRKDKINKDAVMIEGIGKLDWSMGMDNSFLGSLMRIEEQKGQGLGYEDMMVLSGYGFRTSFFDGWCPSSPDATCGFNAGAEILTGLGYDFEFIHLDADDNCEKDSLAKYMNKAEMINEIKASIDEGWPLIAIDLIKVPEWGVITGYQKGGKELLCRTYYDQTEGYEIAWKMPFAIVRIYNKEEVEIAPLYPASLKLAKTLYETERYDQYTNGIFAIDTWLEHLKKTETLKTATAEKFAEMSFANTWIHYCLVGSRAITASYLESNKAKFQTDGEILGELIGIYQKEADILKKGLEYLAPLEGSATPETWTAEMRAKEILTLEEFRNLELRAQQILIALN